MYVGFWVDIHSDIELKGIFTEAAVQCSLPSMLALLTKPILLTPSH